MSNNGQFKLSINELCKTASRAMYTLLGNINKFYAGNVRILIDLFDKMILPICLYNCEVWGATFFSSRYSPKDFLSEKQHNNPVDKLQGSFLKHILGVHSRTSNWAVESETNRNSAIPSILKKMVGFYDHLKSSESPIILESIQLSEQLNKDIKPSWFKGIVKIGEILGTPIDQLANSKVLLNRKLQECFRHSWHQKRNFYSQGKLDLYTSLKESPGFENYLNIPNQKLRQAITRMRISSHKFPIETGRFEHKERSERICPLCCDGIGDEVHYLISCQNDEMSRIRKE